MGDVYDKFKKLNHTSTSHVSALLTVAIAEAGPEASVAEAMKAVVSCAQGDQAKEQALDAKLRKVEEAEERLKAATAAPKKLPIPSVPAHILPKVMTALGRKPKKGRTIEEPVVGAAVTTVVYAYADARGVPQDKTEAKWGKKHAGTLPTFDAISKIIGQLNACPTVLLRLNLDDSGDFLKVRNEGQTAEKITVLEALELSQQEGTAFLQVARLDPDTDDEKVKLSPLMPAA